MSHDQLPWLDGVDSFTRVLDQAAAEATYELDNCDDGMGVSAASLGMTPENPYDPGFAFEPPPPSESQHDDVETAPEQSPEEIQSRRILKPRVRTQHTSASAQSSSSVPPNQLEDLAAIRSELITTKAKLEQVEGKFQEMDLNITSTSEFLEQEYQKNEALEKEKADWDTEKTELLRQLEYERQLPKQNMQQQSELEVRLRNHEEHIIRLTQTVNSHVSLESTWGTEQSNLNTEIARLAQLERDWNTERLEFINQRQNSEAEWTASFEQRVEKELDEKLEPERMQRKEIDTTALNLEKKRLDDEWKGRVNSLGTQVSQQAQDIAQLKLEITNGKAYLNHLEIIKKTLEEDKGILERQNEFLEADKRDLERKLRITGQLVPETKRVENIIETAQIPEPFARLVEANMMMYRQPVELRSERELHREEIRDITKHYEARIAELKGTQSSQLEAQKVEFDSTLATSTKEVESLQIQLQTLSATSSEENIAFQNQLRALTSSSTSNEKYQILLEKYQIRGQELYEAKSVFTGPVEAEEACHDAWYEKGFSAGAAAPKSSIKRSEQEHTGLLLENWVKRVKISNLTEANEVLLAQVQKDKKTVDDAKLVLALRRMGSGRPSVASSPPQTTKTSYGWRKYLWILLFLLLVCFLVVDWYPYAANFAKSAPTTTTSLNLTTSLTAIGTIRGVLEPFCLDNHSTWDKLSSLTSSNSNSFAAYEYNNWLQANPLANGGTDNWVSWLIGGALDLAVCGGAYKAYHTFPWGFR